MDEQFLQILRCPIDPTRTATLRRERDELICERCEVRYPVKQGLPVLIPDEASLPDGCQSRHDLPCLRK